MSHYRHNGPGYSEITPLKHKAMWGLVAEETGAVPYLGLSRMVWYDLTAGNANLTYEGPWEETTSAGILAHHAAHGQVPARVILHEKARNVYDELKVNLFRELGARGWSPWRDTDYRWVHPNGSALEALHKEGETADLSVVRGTDAVLIFNDPNNVHGWAMREGFAREAAQRTWAVRTLSTLGCNAGGLKMLPREKRERWFTFPESLRAGQPGYRDILLAAVDRDDAQWAYMISTSARSDWRKKAERRFRSAAARTGRTVSMAWYSGQPREFDALTTRLFLTKEEGKG